MTKRTKGVVNPVIVFQINRGELYAFNGTAKTLIKNKSAMCKYLDAKLKAVNGEDYDEDLVIMCSSSVDFPEESTTSNRVIEMCHALRGDLEDEMAKARKG